LTTPLYLVLQAASLTSSKDTARLGQIESTLLVMFAAVIVFVAFVLQYDPSVECVTNRTQANAWTSAANAGESGCVR